MTKTRIVTLLITLTSVLLIWGAFTPTAEAHAKWFYHAFDITKAPLPIGQVLTKTFVFVFLASVFSIYFFYVTDRYLYKKGYLVQFDEKLRRLDNLSIYIMRISAGIFFISVSIYSQINNQSFFITPELTTEQAIIPWLQLVIGLFALSRYTTPLIGVGIIALYIDAVIFYGIYHLLDYLIFLGIAYFFLVTVSKSDTWKKSGFIVLYATTGINLVWLSIEKFGFPSWTLPLLDPRLLMGLPPDVFIVLAGFVEFNITFILLSAASVLTRLIALVLDSVFILAILSFGLLDALGHLMIIAILVVLIVRGPTDARNMLVLNEKVVWLEAYFMTGLYFLAFVMFFIMYYGFHYLAFEV